MAEISVSDPATQEGSLFPTQSIPVHITHGHNESSYSGETSASSSVFSAEDSLSNSLKQLSLTPTSNFPLSHTDHPRLSPFEVLLTVYTPIFECLSSYLDTYEKLQLTHVSPHLRRLCHSYPPFWAHPDFHLEVTEGERYDAYGIGKVYNLDALLSVLPLEGRLVSLNVDWTAITGHYLFKIVDKCATTLQHLSVRGCRKVSIKHHIVPHFVHQNLIEPYSIAREPELAGTGSGGWRKKKEKPYRALKSLHAWKARGVRRKPFLIDRKEADGDEPTRYLTLLAAALNIFVDVGLCSTPKLRCPRRREITRRLREKFCVPFDRRWRESNPSLIEAIPSLVRKGTHRNITCDSCGDDIEERCEACAVAMHCVRCAKNLCHACTWNPPFSSGHSSSGSSSGDGLGAGGHANVDLDADGDPHTPVLTPAMKPCCVDTLPFNALLSSRNGDLYCEECYDLLEWGRCDGCRRAMCMKHEWSRRKTCGGGCGRNFCFPQIGGAVGQNGNQGQMGGGAAGCDMGGVRECVGCGLGVCTDCRRQTACPCQLCIISFYCSNCWGSKPFSCDGDLYRRKSTAQMAINNFSSTMGESAQSSTLLSSSTAGNLTSNSTGNFFGPPSDFVLTSPRPLLPSPGSSSSHPSIHVEAEDEGDGVDDTLGFEEEDDDDNEGELEDDEEEDDGGEDDEVDEEDNEITLSVLQHPNTSQSQQQIIQSYGDDITQHLTPDIHEQIRQAIVSSDFPSMQNGIGNSSNQAHDDVGEQMSLLVLDDDVVPPRSPSVVTTGMQSPGATTPLTPPSHTRPSSRSGSGNGTPTAQDLLDPIDEWDVLDGPSLL